MSDFIQLLKFEQANNYGYTHSEVKNLVIAQENEQKKMQALLQNTMGKIQIIFTTITTWEKVVSFNGKTINDFSENDLKDENNLTNFNKLKISFNKCHVGWLETQIELFNNLENQYTQFIADSHERLEKLQQFKNHDVAKKAARLIILKLNSLYKTNLEHIIRQKAATYEHWNVIAC